MLLPPRHAQLIRADPCHPWFDIATHTGRFTPAARQNATTSTRDASCLQVLTLAITGLARVIIHVKTGCSPTPVHCIVILLLLGTSKAFAKYHDIPACRPVPKHDTL